MWQPPGAAAISVAAVVPGYVFYSCAGGKVSHTTWIGAMLRVPSTVLIVPVCSQSCCNHVTAVVQPSLVVQTVEQ